ncbi:MAG: VWA domain-containing protein [Planctomycetaceae bacterium]|nr:VWA domain-containing protein [Planctomycetaceae bacterium]
MNNNHTTDHLDADDLRAEIEDQLMDGCLDEVLGGVSPHLEDRTTKPVALAPSSHEEPVEETSAPRRLRWAAMLVALGLCLGVGVALQSGVLLPSADEPENQVAMSEGATQEDISKMSPALQSVTLSGEAEPHPAAPFAANDDFSSLETVAEESVRLAKQQGKSVAFQIGENRKKGSSTAALGLQEESRRLGELQKSESVDGLARFDFAGKNLQQLNRQPGEAGTPVRGRVVSERYGRKPVLDLAGESKLVREAAPAAEATLGWRKQNLKWDDKSWYFDSETDGSEGVGPGNRGDNYAPIIENEFQAVGDAPLSTFSIDVDTASYSNVRRMLTQNNMLPPPDAVRIEELVNYFNYDYEAPVGDDPFSVSVDASDCPWRPEHKLVRIALKGKEIPLEEKPASNLVFLLDVSGSMNQPNKIELLKSCLKMMVDYLGENDSIAIVTYASGTRVVLPSTSGDQKAVIMNALDNLRAGGSTNGAAGIQLAYEQATKNFIPGGINRVILATDGDFNVGITSQGDLHRMIEEKAKSNVFLTTLGFGFGNLQDNTIELLADKGNGNYAYIDTLREGRKVLIDEMGSTLHTIAKDVKIQIEFNPLEVAAYRLIGYENRILAARDFNDDTKDAGEIGAGHTVTALYQLIPAGEEPAEKEVDELEFQKPLKPSKAAKNGDMMVVKLRYKQPTADKSQLLKMNVADKSKPLVEMSRDFQFASAVASFGMILRGSQFKGHANYDSVLEIAESSLGENPESYRQEFVELVKRAKSLDQRH